MKDTARKKIVLRAYVALIAIISASLVVIGKIIKLQLTTPEEEKENVSVVNRAIKPKRGDIYSSDGMLLATSVCYYNAYLDLACPGVKSMTDSLFDAETDSLSICLAKLFGDKSKETYKTEIRNAKNRGNRCYCIKRNITFLQFEEMRKFPYLRRGKYKAGFYWDEIYKREKPFGMLARRTIGEKDKFGLELSYDSILSGVEGFATFQKVSKDVWVPIENAEEYVKPVDGHDIITTIDIGLQDIAETALDSQMNYCKAQYGTVVVMEVKTGKVRAIANLMRDSVTGKCSEVFNYAVGNLSSGVASDPGSTFKIASLIVAMEDGYITPETMVKVGDGNDYYYDRRIRDSHRPDSTWLSVRKIIETSSNVGTARFVYDNYHHQQQKFIDGLKRLHLHEPLGINLIGEAPPVIHEPGSKHWSGISLPWMAYGYGVTISPMQMLAFYNAIANDGKMLRPMFVEALSYRGEIVEEFEPYVIDQRICSQKTIDAVKEMLVGVVQNGTATNLKNENYPIAGKTGTAQMNYGKRQKLSYHASFVGYFPADNPEYSCIVSIYNPTEGSIYGNRVAGGVFRKIADKIYSTDTKVFMHEECDNPKENLPISKSGKRESIQKVCEILGIPSNIENFPTVNWIRFCEVSDGRENFTPLTQTASNLIPNVRNMVVTDAVKILETAGMKVVVSGRGRVVSQVPAGGTICAKGDIVSLILK